MKKHRDRKAFVSGVSVSIFAHICMLIAVISAHQAEPAAEPAAEEEAFEAVFIAPVDLLQWGEEMPSARALPNLPNPAPAPEPEILEETAPPEEETTVPVEEIVVLDQPEPIENPDPVEQVETEIRSAQSEEQHEPEQEERQFRGEHNFNRPTNTDTTHGQSDGFVGGTSLSEHALRNILSRIQEQLQRAFRAPRSLSRDELSRLSARVRVRVDSSGRVTNFSFVSESGNRLFDAQVQSMLGRFRNGSSRLDVASITDETVRRQIENDGFVVTIQDR